MIDIQETQEFARWFSRLRNRTTRGRIRQRIRRLALGNPGDVRPVGEGVSELRIDIGPGYRVYYRQHGDSFVMLLAGGDKGSQERDIGLALDLARAL